MTYISSPFCIRLDVWHVDRVSSNTKSYKMCREIVPIPLPFTDQQFVTYCELQIRDKEQWFFKYLLSILTFPLVSANREWWAGWDLYMWHLCYMYWISAHQPARKMNHIVFWDVSRFGRKKMSPYKHPIPPKRQYGSIGKHGVTLQKAVIIYTAVSTASLTHHL